MLPLVLRALARPLPKLVSAVVSSGWVQDRGVYGPHRALDIPVPVGTPIYAVASGKVIRWNPTNNQEAGIFVGLEHDGGVVSRYMHMSKIGPQALGASVRKGDLIGWSGDTGNSALPHLHLDLSVPASALPDVVRVAGQPNVGWGASSPGPWFQAPYGYKIPAEPWVPVDGYSTRTLADATKAKIPLYTQHPELRSILATVGGSQVALIAAAAVVGLFLAR